MCARSDNRLTCRGSPLDVHGSDLLLLLMVYCSYLDESLDCLDNRPKCRGSLTRGEHRVIIGKRLLVNSRKGALAQRSSFGSGLHPFAS